MANHLTGWRLSAGDELTVFDGQGRKLVDVPCGGLTGRRFEQAAECARLIVGASDILAAISAIADYPLPYIENEELRIEAAFQFLQFARQTARASIAKVRGEA